MIGLIGDTQHSSRFLTPRMTHGPERSSGRRRTAGICIRTRKARPAAWLARWPLSDHAGLTRLWSDYPNCVMKHFVRKVIPPLAIFGEFVQ